MKFFSTLILVFSYLFVISQTNDTVKNGHKIFYYPNNVVSSEGTVVDGKPNGYWKSFYIDGKLKSEGNRKNYVLDSIWVFYNENGDTTEKINYLYGKKNGYQFRYNYYFENEHKFGGIISKELYLEDVKQGKSFYYYKNGNIFQIVNYQDGKRQSITKEFDENGKLIALKNFKNDIEIGEERINRCDERGLKQGIWKEFYQNDKLKTEVTYLNDKYHGYYKEYDEKGKLIKTVRYENGMIVEGTKRDTSQVVAKNLFYVNGKMKETGGFRDNIRVGIHHYYSESGKIESASIYDDFGNVIAKGNVDEQGKYSGIWKEYYSTGEIKAEGKFVNDRKSGEWKFYHKNGNIEQNGKFIKGKADGLWQWFYENDSIKREEEFENGLEEGQYIEYDENRKVIAKGMYKEGEKEGLWVYDVGDHIQTGEYKMGLREGIWKYYYPDGKLKFEGNYIQGNEDGKHKWYYNDGKLKEEQFYIFGIRERVWKTYSESGNLMMTITYKNDKEIKINGRNIEDNSSFTRKEELK